MKNLWPEIQIRYSGNETAWIDVDQEPADILVDIEDATKGASWRISDYDNMPEISADLMEASNVGLLIAKEQEAGFAFALAVGYQTANLAEFGRSIVYQAESKRALGLALLGDPPPDWVDPADYVDQMDRDGWHIEEIREFDSWFAISCG